jgi:hypothetical protein
MVQLLEILLESADYDKVIAFVKEIQEKHIN